MSTLNQIYKYINPIVYVHLLIFLNKYNVYHIEYNHLW